MPLFGKSNTDKPNLIETVGPVPDGYHLAYLIYASEVGHDPNHLERAVVKNLSNQCDTLKCDGFCNLRLTASSDGTTDSLYAYADAIKAN